MPCGGLFRQASYQGRRPGRESNPQTPDDRVSTVRPTARQGWVARLGARGRLALKPAEAFTADGREVLRRNCCEAAPQGHQIYQGAPLSVVSSVDIALCPSVGTSDDVRAGGRGGASVFAKP